MSFCSGVEDSLIISIGNEFNDDRIIKIYEILDERLKKYCNELNNLKKSPILNNKRIKKLQNRIIAI